MLVILLGGLDSAQGQTDDFADGDDVGWTRFDPIGQLTGEPFAAHIVQSGQYRLSANPSPDPATVGPARVASYRADTVFTHFTAVVDVVSWNAALDQAIGLLARIQPNPAAGSLSGYSLNYQPGDEDIEINRLTAEVPVNLARMAVNLAPGESYRFVFTGQGSQLRAAVYSLASPLVPVVTLAAVDTQFSQGHCGIFAYDASNTGAVNATFDSYSAGPKEVPTLAFAASATDFSVFWPRRTGAWHLESSTDLADWSDVLDGGMVTGEMLGISESIAGRKFFRLAEGWRSPGP